MAAAIAGTSGAGGVRSAPSDTPYPATARLRVHHSVWRRIVLLGLKLAGQRWQPQLQTVAVIGGHHARMQTEFAVHEIYDLCWVELAVLQWVPRQFHTNSSRRIPLV